MAADGTLAAHSVCGLQTSKLQMPKLAEPWADWSERGAGRCRRCKTAITRREAEGDEIKAIR
jgi:hypothetical protein